jgi:hypothetical protein
MWIIGVDYHSSVQQIAFTDTETGECRERRLNLSDGRARLECSRDQYKRHGGDGCGAIAAIRVPAV